MTSGPFKIRPVEASDCESIWLWRNAPSVRAYMFNTAEITWPEHVAWFERTLQDPGTHVLVFESQGNPAGIVNIRELGQGGVAEWGFYKVPEAPAGTGKALGAAALQYAFDVLHLHKVYAQVLGFNKRSVDLHVALGFVQEGVLRDQHYDGRAYHDVYCFGLKRDEWANSHRQTGLNI